LPSFKGATFRGGFGYTLKRICCVMEESSCNDCMLRTKCIYCLFFETKNNKEHNFLGFLEPPRPFALELPVDEKRVYQQGETLEINILIFGNQVQFLPYIVLTFSELGRKGLGRTRVKYDLLSVETIYGETIYDAHTKTFCSRESTVKLSFDENIERIKEVKIKFLTPTRIKTEGRYTKDLSFATLTKAILRRLAALFLFYADRKLDCAFEEIIKEAERVSTKSSSLRWVDVERFSTRQKARMKLGGVVGEVVYQGELTKFYPILKVGEYIHVGKNTTFGLGKYEIVEIN